MNNIPDLLDSVNSVASLSSVFKNSEPRTLNSEPAHALAHHSPDIILKAAMHVAATNLFEILFRCSDPAALIKRLKEKPELHLQIINCQANLLRAHIEQQKFELQKQQAEAKQRAREQKLRSHKPILLTDATLHRFAQVASARNPNPNPNSLTNSPAPYSFAQTGRDKKAACAGSRIHAAAA